MPWLPMYLVAEDARSLIGLLNRDQDVAFLVTDGPGRWIARNELSEPSASRISLWHIPSGPLPLLGERTTEPVGQIGDPWSGWTERRQGADSTNPYFGPGHPGVIWLNLRLAARDLQSICGLSSFEWIGNHYSLIGNAAKPATEHWWRKLRRNVQKAARKVPRVRLDSPLPAEVYAFPAAYELLKAGRSADANP